MNLDRPSIQTQPDSLALLNTESKISIDVLRSDSDYRMGEVTLAGENPYQREQRRKEQLVYSAMETPKKPSVW